MSYFDTEFTDKELNDISNERRNLIKNIEQNKIILDKFTDVSTLFVCFIVFTL
jgi:hypothetical protein